MTEQQRKLDGITDAIYYYMVELVSQAGNLEEIGLEKEGEELRSIADQIERLGIRLLNRKVKRRKRTV